MYENKDTGFGDSWDMYENKGPNSGDSCDIYEKTSSYMKIDVIKNEAPRVVGSVFSSQ